MTAYQKLYNSYPFPEQIVEIKKNLQNSSSLSWEDYYWGIKCIIEYSTEPNSPDFITDMLNSALRQGLTMQNNPDLYKDCLKELSAYYTMYGKYSLVSNQLNLLLDSDPDNAPDWVYHDLIAANIHDNFYIARTIKSPSQFYEDLKRDDGTNEFIKTKQKNLLKDFLQKAAEYISKNGRQNINYDSIKAIADEFSATDSFEWANFDNTVNGRPLLDEDSWEKTNEKPTVSTGEGKSGELNDAVTLLEKKIKRLEEEISTYSKEAEKDKILIDSLQAKIDDLLGENSTLDGKVNGLRLKLEQAMADSTVLRQEKVAAEQDLISVIKEKEILKSALSQLQKKYDQIAAAGKQDENLSRQLNELRSQITGKDRLIAEYLSRISYKDEEISLARKKIAALEKQAAKYKEELEVKKPHISKLEADNKELNRRVTGLRERERENAAEISELKIKLEEALENAAGSTGTVEDPVQELYYYVFVIAPKVSAKWLKKKLAQLSSNWWEEYVLSILSEDSKRRLQQKSSRDISDLDIYDITDAVYYNREELEGKNLMTRDNIKRCSDMHLVRNKWAHISANGLTKEIALQSVSTIKGYYAMVGASEYIMNLDYLYMAIKQSELF